ncbi:hypothetical protein P691DRAFT_789692 [Macrolepiota fuliginosa MF-IS2]|uniref:Nephrocystin 3-like N-terminal domain-containing protein n=1 Tax=Macrolepiota fuliginosa MF-IS2 TaxID=1400762 RepID=A0A9P6C3K7_9AGAR|nr:hypothetical protein P691DRAFT_789692 [Macrolepiota fuliginosa MF-IS2]
MRVESQVWVPETVGQEVWNDAERWTPMNGISPALVEIIVQFYHPELGCQHHHDHAVRTQESPVNAVNRKAAPPCPPPPLPTMGNRQSSPVRDGHQYFNNARNFIIQNSTLGDMAPNSVLEWLGKHVIPGAEFDSSERDPPPRCHPGTRLSIVQRIQIWLQNADRSKNLLWLHGLARVGKSAIIQSLAESKSKSKSKGVIATLFFSALKGRNDPNRVFTTLAYQFAVQDPSYRAYVVELMSQDPRSLDKAMSEQFRKLFIEPFTQRGIGKGATPWLILLDGLDECRPPGAKSQAQSPSERTQCEIVKLISTFVLEYPSVPLLWIISSRPESHLMACFSSADVHAAHWDEDVPIDSDEACQDVERYLRSEFEKIREQYPYQMPTASPWPCEEHMAVIARSALGHFVFAATVMKFVEDPDIGDPIAQLDQILVFIRPRYMDSVEGNPLAALDALYTSILQQINPTTLPLTKRLLGYYVLSEYQPTYQCLLTVVCNILNIGQNRAYSALRKLHAVLHIPHPTDAGEQTLEFLHKSFIDYLQNEDRSCNFSLGEVDAAADPWLCSTRVLEQAVVPREDELVARIPNVDLQNPFSQVTGLCQPLSTLLDRLQLCQEQYPWVQVVIIGASPSTSCIVFRCCYTSDGKFVDQGDPISALKSEPEGTKITQEDFVLPYFG